MNTEAVGNAILHGMAMVCFIIFIAVLVIAYRIIKRIIKSTGKKVYRFFE